MRYGGDERHSGLGFELGLQRLLAVRFVGHVAEVPRER